MKTDVYMGEVRRSRKQIRNNSKGTEIWGVCTSEELIFRMWSESSVGYSVSAIRIAIDNDGA